MALRPNPNSKFQRSQFQTGAGAPDSWHRTAATRGCSGVARRGQTSKQDSMHRTFTESSASMLAVIGGLNPPVVSALASSAPAAGLKIYHFQPLARHRLPSEPAPAWAANVMTRTLECGLLAWDWWGIDVPPHADIAVTQMGHSAGAWSDCTRECHLAAGFQVDLGAQPDGRLPVMQCHGARPRRVDCSTLARFEAGHAAPSTLCDELCMPVGTIHGRLEL